MILKMDTSNLKNIVVLKDLPSNLVEEAIVVLKANQKIEKLELIDSDNKSKNNSKTISPKNNNSKDYIIKEAQLLISEFITKIENKNKTQTVSKLTKQCKTLKLINKILIAGLMISITINFIL